MRRRSSALASKTPEVQPAALPPPPPRLGRSKAKPLATRRRAAKSAGDLDRLARRLEADWQLSLRKHEEAVHKQFVDLRSALHNRKANALKGKAVADLREALAPKLKPKQGRVKDLRRVEDALGVALGRIP